MVSNLIYKVTGRMTNKKIVKTAEKIGTELLNRANQNAGNIKVEDIKDVLALNIGNKKASTLIVSDKLDDFVNFVKKFLGFSDELGEKFFYQTKAAVVPGGGKTNNLFLKIDLTAFENLGEKVNTISHECEHLLHKKLSYRALLEKMQVKILGKKWLQRYMEKYVNLMNEKVFELQGNLLGRLNIGECATGFTEFKKGSNPLLKQLELKSSDEMVDELRCLIKDYILLPKGDKKNLKILKALRGIMKDESRAYKVGGKLEAKASPNIDNVTKSELLAQYYDEAIKVLKQEIKNERKNRVRGFCGLKRKD
jgi:hypothetical protein